MKDRRRRFIHSLAPLFSPLLKPRAYKTIEDEDLKFPLIYGEGKKVRECVRTPLSDQQLLESKGRNTREAVEGNLID